MEEPAGLSDTSRTAERTEASVAQGRSWVLVLVRQLRDEHCSCGGASCDRPCALKGSAYLTQKAEALLKGFVRLPHRSLSRSGSSAYCCGWWRVCGASQ